ncbi:MAG: BAAT/acyl-CoA thioester hydrolase C-terminal domain protein [Paenibacillus sp.]|nr:BAAT/acyl-CoA thioester hydrolase C-terminal domain protein [Paenibacillus sp.]
MNIWIGTALLAAAASVAAISLFVVWKLMHPKRKPLNRTPEFEHMAYEEIMFWSRDQAVQLHGWFLPAAAKPKMTIIFAHGYRDNRLIKHVYTLHLAKALVKQGYNAILFDFRNCGESGGTLTTIGLDEQQDVLGAIDWCKRHTKQPIGLIGYSMGAATSLLAAAQSDDVAGVIADSPFSDLNRYLLDNLSVWSKLPKYPFSPLMVLAIRFIMRKNPQLVKPIASLQRIYPRPVLFIHGDRDSAIPYSNSAAMYRRHSDAFSLWQVAGASHIGSYRLYPQEYTDRVIDFFDGLAGGRI